MRTFFKELILPRILEWTLAKRSEWQYVHTVSLCGEKTAALIHGYSIWERMSWRGELWWPLVFSGQSFAEKTRKIKLGRQLEQAKYGANTKARIFFSFFHFEDTTLVSMPRVFKWIAWGEWLWCDNHFQVNLSSLTSAQGIQCAISRKTKKR